MDIATASLYHHGAGIEDEVDNDEGVRLCHNNAQAWTEHPVIRVAPDFNEMLDDSQVERAFLSLNDVSADIYSRQETFTDNINDPLQTIPTPGSVLINPVFHPCYQPETTIIRPIGYEDKRPTTSREDRHQDHPKRYNTDWNAFVISQESQQDDDGDDQPYILFNVRASNIDRDFPDAEIEAFFKARCIDVERFRSKTGPRRKVVHLAISKDSAWHEVMALDGSWLGRHQVRVEWNSNGFEIDRD